MNIDLLLNSAECVAGISTSGGGSLEVPIPSPLPHSAESGQNLVTVTQSPYISYQTQNLRRGPCTIHPISPPQRRNFTPEEDALLQYMIDSIQSGRVKILSICLKRNTGAIITRWDVLDLYKPCSACFQCQRFQKRIGELRRNYQGSDWTITHYFLNTKIYVAIPPPCFIEQGAKIPLPIVVRLSGQDSSLSPYITLNNVRLQGQQLKEKHGDATSYAFFCEQFFQSGRLRLCFQSQTKSYHIDFDITCVMKLDRRYFTAIPDTVIAAHKSTQLLSLDINRSSLQGFAKRPPY